MGVISVLKTLSKAEDVVESKAKNLDFTSLAKKETPSSASVDFGSLKPKEAPVQEPYKLEKADELALMDVEDTYKSGLISKKEYDEEVEMIKNPVDTSKDTRGQGVQYHGTSSEIEDFDNNYYTTMNIYGQGFYTTDATDIASGYSKKGKGKNPAMYKVIKKKDVKLYDMEEPLASDFKQQLEEADINTEGLTTLREVYDELRGEEFMTADEVQEIFSTVSYMLEEKGFDGLRHVGGNFTKNKPHNVEIIFKPKDVLDIKKLRTVAGAALAVTSGAAVSGQSDVDFTTLKPKVTKEKEGSSVDFSSLTLKEPPLTLKDIPKEDLYRGSDKLAPRERELEALANQMKDAGMSEDDVVAMSERLFGEDSKGVIAQKIIAYMGE